MTNIAARPDDTLRAEIRAQVVTESLDMLERIALLRSDPSRFEPDDALSSDRIDRWRGALGFETEDALQDRFESLGITSDDVPLLLGRLKPDTRDPVPGWWRICEEVLLEPAPGENEDLDGFLAGEEERPLPFEHAIVPWVRVATRMLEEKVPEQIAGLEPAILRKEQRGLLENIASIVRMILVGDFEAYKMRSYDSNDLFLGMTVSKPPDDSYLKFTREILEDSWRFYMVKYPAMARLLATRVELWVHSFGEFLERLEADCEELERVYSPGSPLGRLVEGARGISDSHNGGRAVVVCTFENGCKVVYKPRQMAVDAAWCRVLEWFNGRFENIAPLVKLDVIDRGPYGWMAFAEHRPCADINEVDVYFERMGTFLCLAHMLHGNDFHLENVIASGPDPTAIDLETITVPEYLPPVPDGGIGASPAHAVFSRSVLRTLLLPMAMAQGGAEARNLGAVGLSIEGAGGRPMHRVLHAINTDFMHWRTVTLEEAQKLGATNMADAMRSNVELADGTEVIPQDHREKLVRGYQAAYKAILEDRDEFLSDNGPIAFFKLSHVRFLNRATNIYYRLLFETCVDKVVGSGVDRWIATDRLAIGFNGEEGADLVFTNYLLEREHEAMLRGDVPYFLSCAGSRRLAVLDINDCGTIEYDKDVLTLSAVSAARRQVEGMSDDDLERQVEFIESSYVTTIISLRKATHGVSSDEEIGALPAQRDFSDDDLAAFARTVIDALLDQALRGENGQLDWVDVSVDPTRDTSQVSPMDAGVYSGRGGMALLFEQAYRRFGDPRYLEAAANSLAIEAYSLDRDLPMILAPSGMLSTAGLMLGGWYLGAHEGHGAWRKRVQDLVSKIGPQAIERDLTFDVIAGSAGQILVLSHLLNKEDIPGAKDLVEELAHYLMRNACDDHGGPSWKTSMTNGTALCGYSHGIAGIALALLHASKITSKGEFRDAALRAVACEHALRSEKFGNWPDFRSQPPPVPDANYQMRAWCHGSPGIALGRAAFVEIEDDPIARDDLEFALATLQDVVCDASTRPHLCCGHGGLGEIRRTIGKRLSRQTETDGGIAMVKQTAQYLEDSSMDRGFMGLGMLQGSSGMAWAALAAEGQVADQLDLLLLGS